MRLSAPARIIVRVLGYEIRSLGASGFRLQQPRYVGQHHLSDIKPKLDIETGVQKPWYLKDLRKTCATYYDEHVPESSVEILGHSVGGVTYRHYARRDPLAFKAIMAMPQPSSFMALVRGHDGECPCCRRPFP